MNKKQGKYKALRRKPIEELRDISTSESSNEILEDDIDSVQRRKKESLFWNLNLTRCKLRPSIVQRDRPEVAQTDRTQLVCSTPLDSLKKPFNKSIPLSPIDNESVTENEQVANRTQLQVISSTTPRDQGNSIANGVEENKDDEQDFYFYSTRSKPNEQRCISNNGSIIDAIAEKLSNTIQTSQQEGSSKRLSNRRLTRTIDVQTSLQTSKVESHHASLFRPSAFDKGTQITDSLEQENNEKTIKSKKQSLNIISNVTLKGNTRSEAVTNTHLPNGMIDTGVNTDNANITKKTPNRTRNRTHNEMSMTGCVETDIQQNDQTVRRVGALEKIYRDFGIADVLEHFVDALPNLNRPPTQRSRQRNSKKSSSFRNKSNVANSQLNTPNGNNLEGINTRQKSPSKSNNSRNSAILEKSTESKANKTLNKSARIKEVTCADDLLEDIIPETQEAYVTQFEKSNVVNSQLNITKGNNREGYNTRQKSPSKSNNSRNNAILEKSTGSKANKTLNKSPRRKEVTCADDVLEDIIPGTQEACVTQFERSNVNSQLNISKGNNREDYNTRLKSTSKIDNPRNNTILEKSTGSKANKTSNKSIQTNEVTRSDDVLEDLIPGTEEALVSRFDDDFLESNDEEDHTVTHNRFATDLFNAKQTKPEINTKNTKMKTRFNNTTKASLNKRKNRSKSEKDTNQLVPPKDYSVPESQSNDGKDAVVQRMLANQPRVHLERCDFALALPNRSKRNDVVRAEKRDITKVDKRKPASRKKAAIVPVIEQAHESEETEGPRRSKRERIQRNIPCLDIVLETNSKRMKLYSQNDIGTIDILNFAIPNINISKNTTGKQTVNSIYSSFTNESVRAYIESKRRIISSRGSETSDKPSKRRNKKSMRKNEASWEEPPKKRKKGKRKGKASCEGSPERRKKSKRKDENEASIDEPRSTTLRDEPLPIVDESVRNSHLLDVDIFAQPSVIDVTNNTATRSSEDAQSVPTVFEGDLSKNLLRNYFHLPQNNKIIKVDWCSLLREPGKLDKTKAMRIGSQLKNQSTGFQVGPLEILPGKCKQKEMNKKFALLFMVVHGEGIFHVHDSYNYVAYPGVVHVPLGVYYSIQNKSTTECLSLNYVKFVPCITNDVH